MQEHELEQFYISYKRTLEKMEQLNIKTKTLILIYFLLIILSTLLVHQHLLIDVIFAFIYSVISLLITHYLFTRKKHKN